MSALTTRACTHVGINRRRSYFSLPKFEVMLMTSLRSLTLSFTLSEEKRATRPRKPCVAFVFPSSTDKFVRSTSTFLFLDLFACSDNALRHSKCTHALRHSTCMCCEHGTCLGWWWEMNHAYGICGRCIILVIHECTALVLPLWMFYDQGMHILCS